VIIFCRVLPPSDRRLSGAVERTLPHVDEGCDHGVMGIHVRTWESPDPERIRRVVEEAAEASRSADGDVRAVMSQLTNRLAAGGDCEKMRSVAELLAEADTAAAEAFAAVREAREAAGRGDAEGAERASANAKQHAIQAHFGADRAMERLP
jgi:hypothetical protein